MNWLQRLFQKNTNKQQDNNLELEVQELEDRLYLAGNVDVTYNERTGDLFVRADRESNRIRISANESGRIVVEGLQRGGSQTTINDSGTSFVVNQTRNGVIPDDLLILTRPGSDFIEVDGIKVNDDIRIVGGGQNDSYKLTDVETGGRLTATGGGGDDHILLQESKFTDVFIPTGGGQDFISWSNSTMAGRGRFILGSGFDGFFMTDSVVNGEVFVVAGGQEDAVYLSNAIIKTELDILLGSFDDTLVVADGTRLPADTVIRPAGARNGDKLVMDDTVNVRSSIVESFGRSFVEENDVIGRFEHSISLPVEYLADTFTSRGFAESDFPLEFPVEDDYTTYYPFAETWRFSNDWNGEIERGYDYDWRIVRLTQGEQYTFETFAGTLNKTALHLHDRGGVRVANDSNGGVGSLSKLRYRAQYTGVYYLGINSNSDNVGTYTVRSV